MQSSLLPSHGSSPVSSPTASAISFDSSSSSGSIAAAADDDRPPEPASSLRFGDIPPSTFPVGMAHSPPPFLLVPSEISPTASSEAFYSKKQLCKCSASPPAGSRSGRDLEMFGTAAFPAVLSELYCCGANASCMVSSPRLSEALMAFQKFLPSNEMDEEEEEEEEEIWSGSDTWPPLDVYSCDDFRMYEFKVRKCVRGRSHDWTECPFAHPGEKARRRDPRRYRYSGTACPDFRKGNCRRGEACEFSHGVFECWLHPMRYRTQPCKDGRNCRRRICFFAHTPEQLRVLPPEGESPPVTPRSGSSSSGSTRSSLLKAAALSGEAYDGSPLRRALAGTLDGSMTFELLLDDVHSKGNAGGFHQQQHHWIGTGSPPNSTLDGFPMAGSSPSSMSSQMRSPVLPLVSCASTWIGAPAHRRHLDRLRSIPTISIPGAEDCCNTPSQRSPCLMVDLMSTLQNLQLSPGTMAAQSWRTVPSCSSAWPIRSTQQQLPSRSAPNTPKSRYVQGIGAQADRASAMGSHLVGGFSNEIVADLDVPDLEWVNELVR